VGPAVALPGKHEPVAHPEQLLLGSQPAEHAAISFRSLPHFPAPASPGGIHDSNGPRRPTPHGGEILVLVHCRDAQKRHAPAVGRPHRGIVVLHAGIQVMDRLGRRVVHSHEAVIPTAAYKCETRAVRGPMQSAILAACMDQLFRLLLAIVVAVQRRGPNLPFAHERHASAFRRHGRTVALADQPRRLPGRRAGHCHNPHLLLRAFRIVGRIGILARPIGTLAAHVDDLAAVGRPLQFGDFLPVVFGVCGDAMAAILGRLGNPDVAHAARVVDPGDLAARRYDGSRRKWSAQNLFEREGSLRAGAGGRNQRHGQETGKMHPYSLQVGARMGAGGERPATASLTAPCLCWPRGAPQTSL
jgi:hypothetical protein